nr:kinesin-like protein kin-5c [Quercus suber]
MGEPSPPIKLAVPPIELAVLPLAPLRRRWHRLRPLSVTVGADGDALMAPNDGDASARRICKLSLRKVFGPSAEQRDLYDQAVIPIVHKVLEGFNCTKRSELGTKRHELSKRHEDIFH